jgi:hypothetical protein
MLAIAFAPAVFFESARGAVIPAATVASFLHGANSPSTPVRSANAVFLERLCRGD